MYTFKPYHNFPFWEGYRESFKIKDFILPSEWINNNFILSSAYALPGPVKLYPWQPPIVDSVVYFDEVYFIAAVQTFKSMATEGIAGYYIDNHNLNILWIYSKREKIEEVFDERLKFMVKEVPAIKKYWNGDEKNLTKKRMKLIHLIIHVASAGIKDDIATHNAGLVLGDEWAKWPKKDFSQKKAIEGRKRASKMVGMKTKTVLCTSPDNDEDPSYIATHQSGILWFNPYHQCPHCGEWQYLVDSQIKELPNKKGIKDHDVVRISNDKAAWYECIKCKQEITENERFDANFKVKWLTKDKKIDFYDIIKDPRRAKKAVFQWNRLVVPQHTFVEQLCDFFSAVSSPDPNDLKTYRNEDNAEWVELKAQKFSVKELKSHCLGYYMFGNSSFVPDGVKIVFAGADAQDDGFYYVVRGWGLRGESWLLRAEFVPCSMKDPDYTNSISVYEKFYDDFSRRPLIKKDGTKYNVLLGLMDRGGHRSEDVDTICRRMYNFVAYIGSRFGNAEKIAKKNKDGIAFGNTKKLSAEVAERVESGIWHLPTDVPDDYCDQFIQHYYEEYEYQGHRRKRWITGDETGNADHFRDCECYCLAAYHYYRVFEKLDDINMEKLESISVIKEDEKDIEGKKDLNVQTNVLSNFMGEMRGMGF